MAIAPQERLHIQPREVEIGQDFVIYDPKVTQTNDFNSLTGFSAEHVLRASDLSLLFRFNTLETYSLDFLENDRLDKIRVAGKRVPRRKRPMFLKVVSELHVGSKPLRVVSEWAKDLHVQIFFPGLSPVFEGKMEFDVKRFSDDTLGGSLSTDTFYRTGSNTGHHSLRSFLFSDFEWLSQMYGKFVKHPARI